MIKVIAPFFFCFLPFISFSQKQTPASVFAHVEKIEKTDPERALKLLNQHKVQLEKTNYYFTYCTLKGAVFQELSNLDSSLYYLKKAESIVSTQSKTTRTAFFYRKYGNYYYMVGDNELAYTYYVKANEIAELVNDKCELYLINNNFGLIFLQQKYYDKAINHFYISLQNTEKSHERITLLNNLGVAYSAKEDEINALAYYKKGYAESASAGFKRAGMSSMEGLSNVYLKLNIVDSALYFAQKVKNLQLELGMDTQLLITYNRLGMIYTNLEQFDIAIRFYKKSIKMAEDQESRHLPYIHSNIADTYKAYKKLDKALEHTILFYELKDSLYSIEKDQRVESLLAKYEYEKKEKQIVVLKNEQKLKTSEIQNQRILFEKQFLKQQLNQQNQQFQLENRAKQISILKKEKALNAAILKNKQQVIERDNLIKKIAIAASILILTSVIFLIYFYQQKIKNQELVAIKSEEINNQNTLKLIKDFELKSAKSNIEGQEKEKERVAKELHDGVAGSLATIQLQLQNPNLTENDNLDRLLRNVNNLYQEVRSISHDLTPPAILFGSFVKFLTDYIESFDKAAPFKVQYFPFIKNIKASIPDNYKVEVYRILQELLNNIIKHAGANTVDVQFNVNDDGIILIVEDDGVGYDASDTRKGLGLTNIETRVMALNGHLEIDSHLQRGTIVSIQLPLIPN